MRAETQIVPPKIKPGATPLAFFAVVVLGGAMLGAGAILFFFDPAKNNFYPVCVFHAMTGLNCPGCGATRAAHQLLHGNFSAALHDNALFVLTPAALAVGGASFAWRKIKDPRTKFILPPKWLWGFLALAAVFTVLRNLPAFSFLSP